MSKLVPNVVDTARIFRSKEFLGKFSANYSSICLTTPMLCFEVSKRDSQARFFADKAMIRMAGGPWFIQRFKDVLETRKVELFRMHLLVDIGLVESKDLFSYRTCNVALDLNHPTRHNTIALQLVQKALLFSIADEILEQEIAAIT